MSETRTVPIGALARVEGEGKLHLRIADGALEELRLEIFEPPRFFEAFLQGRGATELPDLVARICGICPVAYQMSVIHALESIFDVTVDPGIRALRRLYYAGEWIESHVLHMAFLAAPDYLGFDDAMTMAAAHRAEVERALSLRQLGNRILALLGGRPVNPVGVCIGGFSRTPDRAELEALAEDLRRARGEAETLIAWFASLDVPRRVQPVELVALRHPDEYPMNEGRIVSSLGLDIPASAFTDHFEEQQVPHSTALHCQLRARGSYQVGPLARVLLNAEHLSPGARAVFDRHAERFAAPDPAAGVFARGIEVLQAIDEAVAVIEDFERPDAAAAAWQPRAGVGFGATEAPRGLLWIRVETDDRGDVVEIRIVPPTSQNQARIEEDLRSLAGSLLDHPEDELRRRCEAAIRDYDPCISCSTHFLTVEVEHR